MLHDGFRLCTIGVLKTIFDRDFLAINERFVGHVSFEHEHEHEFRGERSVIVFENGI